MTGLCGVVAWVSTLGLLLAMWSAASPAQPDYSFRAVTPGPATPPVLQSREDLSQAAARVLEEYADKALAADGILDVRQAPYLAKGDGVNDDTAALQRAITDARAARLVAWLPAGTYLVSDTLSCVQEAVDPRPGPEGGRALRLRGDDFPCVIQGPSRGSPAVIRLKAGAPGFDDARRPKPVLVVWARRWSPPHELASNVSFNQSVVSLRFDISGHAGAIALDVQGAQGTVVENVDIDARGAFAGMRGLQGSGGSTTGLTVTGGAYGVYAVGLGPFSRVQGSQPAPLLTHANLLDQTEAAIFYQGRGPLTVVGARIRGGGVVAQSWGPLYDGALNLIDSSIDMHLPAPAVQSDRPVYIANSYVRASGPLVRLAGRKPIVPTGKDWTRVDEYAGAPAGPFPIWVDGRRVDGDVVRLQTTDGPDLAALQAPHALAAVPDWNDPSSVNVRKAPFGAKGDGLTDDIDALQRAIDEHRQVFLPKGRYKISRTLKLHRDTVLYGVGRVYSEITQQVGAPAFSNAQAPAPLVRTDDDPEARTTLALVHLRAQVAGAFALHWRAGAQSAVRNISVYRWPALGVGNHAHVLVDGQGGGRWFNFGNISGHDMGPGYRHLLVRGTRQPLTFYMLNAEYGRGDAMVELDSASNVTIHAFKGETTGQGSTEPETRPLMWARASNALRIHGIGGLMGAAERSSPYLMRFLQCNDVVLANFAHQRTRGGSPETSRWSVLIEERDGNQVSTPADESFTLYRRSATSPPNGFNGVSRP